MLKTLKKLGSKYRIILFALYALIALLMVMTSISPMSRSAEAKTTSVEGYKLYVTDGSGQSFASNAWTYGSGDYAHGESLEGAYTFYDPNGNKTLNWGRGQVTTLTAPVYAGDTIKIQITAWPQASRDNSVLIVHGGTQTPAIDYTGKIDYKVPDNMIGDVYITARDRSTVHSANNSLGGSYFYVLKFRVASREIAVGGQSVDGFVSNMLNIYTYTGAAISPLTPLATYITYASGTYSGVNAGDYYVYLKPRPRYKWSDGTYEAKLFVWKIKKAAHPANISFTNGSTVSIGTDLNIGISNNKGAVTYSVIAGTGDGVMSGSTFVPTKAGTVTIRATVAESTNYLGVTKDLVVTITKGNQNFDFVSGFDPLECFKESTLDISGTLTSTGGRTWSSSDPSIISVDQNGKLTAHNKIGSVTITITIAEDGNFFERTITKVINTVLINGFYIGDTSSTSHAVYATLQEAVDAANDGETVMVRGINTSSEVVEVASNKNIRIVGEEGAKISATGTNGGILSVKGNLELHNLILNGNNISGNSIINIGGGTITVSNTQFLNGKAENGGAIFVGENSNLTIKDTNTEAYNTQSSFVGNSAVYGGAIYVTDGASSVKILTGAMSNNYASNLGNAVYTNNNTIELNGTNDTVGITDSIGIGGSGSIKVLDSITHKVSVAFANPDSQLSATKPYVFSDTITGAALKDEFRVVNSGYTFDGEKVENTLVLQKSSAEVARYADADGQWHTFSNIQEAIDAASKLNIKVDILLVQYQNDFDSSLNNSVIEVAETIVIQSGANITFGSVLKHTDSTGSSYTYETPTTPTVLKRGDNLTGELICVDQGGILELGGNTVADVDEKTAGDQPSLSQIIIDGAANFGGNFGVPTVTDDQKGGAGTAVTNNVGITAHAPLIVNNGYLYIKEGTTLQNNDNNYAKPGEGFGSHNYGGGIRNQGNGELVMSGGSITNCYSREGGAIININRPEKDSYVENGNPSVKIQGGTISNNASQMKGSAIQTIYGGANTEITGGTIENNTSLHDLGMVSVEEGGSLTIGGGTLAAGGTNKNAVYVYNKYSLEDYKNATTKPFIEGKDPAKLVITNSPTITGDIHLDNSCYVVDTTTTPWGESNKFYETFVDMSGYTGSELNIDINKDRPYGQVAVSTTDNLDKLTVNYPSKDKDYIVGDRFGYITKKDGKSTLNYGGYDIKIGQTAANSIIINGVCDKNIQQISVEVGGKTVILTVTDGVINQSINLGEGGATLLGLKVKVEYADCATQLEKTFDNAVKLILFDKVSGVISVPADTSYLDKDGQKQTLTTGTLPNDIKIDENGNAIFYIGEEERIIAIGTREETPDPTDETIKGGLKDFGDTSITIEGAVGYEYNLIKDGVLIENSWKKVANNGENITFSSLDADSEYQVVIRKVDGTSTKIPSEYVPLTGEAITTLTAAEQAKKVEFQNEYNSIKDKMYDGSQTPKATSAEIKAVIDKHNALGADIKNLTFIKDYKTDLDDGFAHVRAEEWKVTHTVILDKDSTELVSADKVLTDKALAEYESLNAETQELLVVEFEEVLLKKKKLLAAQEIDQLLKTTSTNSEDCQSLAKRYIEMINNPDVKGLEEMNSIIKKAEVGLAIQSKYDNVVAESGDKMTAESIVALKNVLDTKLYKVLVAAPSDNIVEIKDSANLELKMEEAKGVIEKHFATIAEEANINGITDATLSKIAEIKDSLIAELVEKGDTVEKIKDYQEAALVTLDKEEGKAILTDYLKDGDAQDIKDLVLGNIGANKAIDGLTLDNISKIDTIVADTKLKIEQERAKDAINEYAQELPTANGNAIKDEYTKNNGTIDGATTAEDIWDLVDIAKTKIWLEDVRTDTLAKVNADKNETKKIENINKIIDDAITATEALTEIADLDTLKQKAKDDALNVIITIDREQVESDHATVLGKELATVTKDDLASIDEAIADLKTNYIQESQDAMDDYRNDLLEKKKAAIIDLISTEKDGSSVDAIADKIIEDIQGVDVSGDTDTDNTSSELINTYKDLAINTIGLEKHKNEKITSLEKSKLESDSVDTLAIIQAGKDEIKNIGFDSNSTLAEQKAAIDTIYISIEADILLQRQKDNAKKEIEDAYKNITGKDDLTIDLITAAKATIDAADSIESINNSLKDIVNGFVDSIIKEKDSDTTKDIATALKQVINTVIANANTEKEVASVLDTAKDFNKQVAEQRLEEKALAKAEIDEIVKNIFGENNLTKEVIDLIESEKSQIDASDYLDYELIIDKAKTKLEIIDYHDKIVAKAKVDGYVGFDDLEKTKKDALANLEQENNQADIIGIKENAIDNLNREEAVVNIKNYITEDESQFVKDVISRGEAKVDVLAKPATSEQLNEIIIDTKKAVDAERFKDRNPIVREDFDKVDENHIGDIAKALEDLKTLPTDVIKDKLDKEAIEEGYTSYKKRLEDIVNKADFELERVKTEEKINALVRDHDGEKVRDILKAELDKIKAEINYQVKYDDESRDTYKEELKDKLEEAYIQAKDKIEHSQLQQRTDNQVIKDVTDRFDSSKYNDAQKEELKNIMEKVQEEIAKIPPGVTIEEKEEAKAKIDKILEDAKKVLSEVKVEAVSTGEIKPNKEPIVSDGTGDYTEKDKDNFWGIVSNDVGMDGAIKLVINKTDNGANNTIKEAAKKDKLVLAEGSQIEGGLNILVENKEIKTSLDIYLLKESTKITQFEGKYTVKVLMTPEMRAMVGLQVVYINDNGTVEVYKTEIEDGKYLVFTTTHFSEFIILGEPEYNLWWLIITLSIIIVGEIIAITIILLKKKKDEEGTKSPTEFANGNANAMLPLGLLGAIIIPTPAIAVCIILGIIAIIGGIVIAYLLLKKNNKKSLLPINNKISDNDTYKETDKISTLVKSKSVATINEKDEVKKAKKDKALEIPKNKTLDNIKSQIPVNLENETFEIMQEVAAADVSKLMSDHIANKLVITKLKKIDKCKTGIINVSLINECFVDGDIVTLKEIIKRVPQFDKKVTYLKVLAKGVLNKKLKVEAEAFSIDAIKMINLVGGKAIKLVD